MVIKLILIEFYACIWARSLVSVKLQTTLWNAFYSFHFIDTETEPSERWGNKQQAEKLAFQSMTALFQSAGQ